MKTIQELAIPAVASILAQAPNQDDVATAMRETVETQMDQNRRMMRKCPHGCQPDLTYEAGVTYGGCEHRGIVMPDWEPVGVRKRWNLEKL